MRAKPLIGLSQVERHRSGREAWLRAAVLGSDDAIVSTASLMIGVAASSASKVAILVAGVAGLVAGAMSMAVGEYVSVSSQARRQPIDLRQFADMREHERNPGAPRASASCTNGAGLNDCRRAPAVPCSSSGITTWPMLLQGTAVALRQ